MSRRSVAAAEAPFTITPVEPSLLDEVVSIHCSAFRGQRHVLLGPSYVRAFINWFAHASDGIALAAVDSDRRVLGYVAGAVTGYQRRLRGSVWPAAVLGLMTRPHVVFSTSLWTSTFQRLVKGRHDRSSAVVLPPPVMCLVVIGVSDDARRRGVGSALMGAFERRACQLGARSVQLFVNGSNHNAIRVYERSGWRRTAGEPSSGYTFAKSLPGSESSS